MANCPSQKHPPQFLPPPSPPCSISQLFPDSQQIVPTGKAGLPQNGANILIVGDSRGCGMQERFKIPGYSSQLPCPSVCVFGGVQCPHPIYSTLGGFSPLAFLTAITQDAPCGSQVNPGGRGKHQYSYWAFQRNQAEEHPHWQ